MLCYVVCFIIGLFGVCLLVWVLIVADLWFCDYLYWFA